MAETIKLAYRGLDPFPCWPWHAMGHLDSLGTVDVKVEGSDLHRRRSCPNMALDNRREPRTAAR
jgi:hypothetical protein